MIPRSASQYLGEIAQVTPVSDPLEERRLILRWQKHRDVTARDKIIASHLRFVVSVARKRSKNPDRLPDLISAGNIGLLKAIDKYDLNRKPATRFLTYAGWWVQKEVADEDYATSSIVHVPTHRQKTQRREYRAHARAVAEYGEGSEQETKARPTPLDCLRSSVNDWLDVAAECAVSSLIEGPDNASASKQVRRAIDLLPPREQTVLNLYFGVKEEPRTFIQIGALLGVSPEYVRQIKVMAAERLKAILENRSITTTTDAY